MPRIVDVEARRDDLAAAAARVIARSGIAGASMREVAAESGWTTGTLAHYFHNKNDLLRFTLEASLDRRRAQRSERIDLAPEVALRDTLMAGLPLDENARAHWSVTVAFCSHTPGDAELARIQRDAYRDHRTNIAGLVARCHSTTETASLAEAERLIAVVDGVAIQALFDPESWPPEHQIAALDAALTRRQA